MKYLKYTLLLIILLTFVSVRAETCTSKQIEELRSKANFNSLKLKYIDKRLNPFNMSYDENKIEASANLSDDVYYKLQNKDYKDILNGDRTAYVYGGIYTLILHSSSCDGIDIYQTDIFLPYYNPKNKNIFDDGSIVIKNNFIVFAISTIIALLAIIFIIFKRGFNNEKIN